MKEQTTHGGQPLTKVECLTCPKDIYVIQASDPATISRARSEGQIHEGSFPGHNVIMAIVKKIGGR